MIDQDWNEKKQENQIYLISNKTEFRICVSKFKQTLTDAEKKIQRVMNARNKDYL